MGIMFDGEEIEASISEIEAQRLVKWLVDHGSSKEEAYEALAYTMNATVEQINEVQI